MKTSNPVSQPPVAEAPERIWIDANSLEYARRRKCGSWWFEPYKGAEETSIEYARVDPASSITEKLQRVIDAVPTSWLDSLLTGPEAVLPKGRYDYNGKDIERLLRAVKKRVADTITAEFQK